MHPTQLFRSDVMQLACNKSPSLAKLVTNPTGASHDDALFHCFQQHVIGDSYYMEVYQREYDKFIRERDGTPLSGLITNLIRSYGWLEFRDALLIAMRTIRRKARDAGDLHYSSKWNNAAEKVETVAKHLKAY